MVKKSMMNLLPLNAPLLDWWQAPIISKFEDRCYDNIRTSVAGILFFGTSHTGSSETQFTMVLASKANLALTGTSRFVGRTWQELIRTLRKDVKRDKRRIWLRKNRRKVIVQLI